MYPGNDIIYVNYETANYEDPVVFDRSRYLYAGGIYALNRNGSLLWEIPLAPASRVFAANNGTIFYDTGIGTGLRPSLLPRRYDLESPQHRP